MADERDAPGVHRPVLPEIIERAGGAPGPRADGAPSVRRGPGLAEGEGQRNDTGMEAVRIVGLDVGVAQGGIAVAVRENIGDGTGLAQTEPTRWGRCC